MYFESIRGRRAINERASAEGISRKKETAREEEVI